jgi:serine phosphatase RsbU (regulator of sigma subunit)
MGDDSLCLERGDLLVLYTDGVTEAVNAHREQFGLARLCAVVEASAHLEVSAIVDDITNHVAQWHTSRVDDATVVVARYVGT